MSRFILTQPAKRQDLLHSLQRRMGATGLWVLSLTTPALGDESGYNLGHRWAGELYCGLLRSLLIMMDTTETNFLIFLSFFFSVAHHRSKFLYFLLFFSTQEGRQDIQKLLDCALKLELQGPKCPLSTIMECLLYFRLYFKHSDISELNLVIYTPAREWGRWQ